MKKKRKKKYKSVITKRIFRSTKKIGLVLFLLFLFLNMGKIQGTSSYFVDTVAVSGNTMSTGYWVPPTISFSSPAHNEVWQVGAIETIMWTVTPSDPHATITNLKLEYECDDEAYTEIHTFSSNPGSYDWTVPESISDSCKIKITATDSNALTNSKESNEFKISYMIVLNEFLPKPAIGNELVEIYNNGTVPVDLNNWFVTDVSGPGTHRRVIDNAHTNTGSTIINPLSSRFLVIQNYDSFYLNDDGDTIKLYDDKDNLIDSYAYLVSDVSTGKTIARSPDGTGDWVDPVPTFGKKNTDSNEVEDFKKYYAKICFDKDNKSLCNLDFMKSLGLIENKKTTDVSTEETIGNNSAKTDEEKGKTIKTTTDNIPSGTEPTSSDNGIIKVPEPAKPIEQNLNTAQNTKVQKEEIKKEETKLEEKATSEEGKKEEKPKEEPKIEEKPEVKKEDAPKEDAIVSENFDYLKIKNITNLC